MLCLVGANCIADAAVLSPSCSTGFSGHPETKSLAAGFRWPLQHHLTFLPTQSPREAERGDFNVFTSPFPEQLCPAVKVNSADISEASRYLSQQGGSSSHSCC